MLRFRPSLAGTKMPKNLAPAKAELAQYRHRLSYLALNASVFATRANALHKVALAIGRGGDREHAEFLRGIPQDEVHHLAMGADVEGADEDIGPRLDEPAL